MILVKDQGSKPGHDANHALCVEVMAKLDQVKVFLQFNKHVHNVLDQVKMITNPCKVAVDKEKNKHQKDFQFQFQKVLMMEQEYDLQEKEKLALEVQEMVIYIYL